MLVVDNGGGAASLEEPPSSLSPFSADEISITTGAMAVSRETDSAPGLEGAGDFRPRPMPTGLEFFLATELLRRREAGGPLMESLVVTFTTVMLGEDDRGVGAGAEG